MSGNRVHDHYARTDIVDRAFAALMARTRRSHLLTTFTVEAYLPLRKWCSGSIRSQPTTSSISGAA
jgi:hypothetical protein